MKLKNPLFKMAANGILGALIGLVSGAILGLAIYFLQDLICYLGRIWGPEPAKGASDMFRCYHQFFSTTFLGMGSGTIIGAVMGSIVGIRKK